MPTTDLSWLAYAGALLLLGGELMALRHWRDLRRVLAFSTVAECGLALVGFAGGEVGQLGGGMHLVYQVVMRLLVVLVAVRLAGAAGSWQVERLAGSGKAAPGLALLFGFGMFSLMGLSPFRGAMSRFLVLYDLMGHGHWLLAAAGTAASIVAAIYSIRVIQAICFADGPAARPAHRAAGWRTPLGLLILVLAVLTALANFEPEPVAHVAAFVFGLTGELPAVEGPWPWLATLPYVGAFGLYLLGGVSGRLRDAAAVLLAAATLALALLTPELEPVSRLFALLFAGVMLLVTVYSTAYMHHEGGERHYFFFLFLMAGSLMGVATAGDLGSFYLFWELMTWSSYLLIVQSRSPESLAAGARYFVMCAGGAYVMLLGVVGLGVLAGGFEFGRLAAGLAHAEPLSAAALAACLLVGFAVKAGLVPLHGWLPVAHPAAPSSVSAPLSSILTKTGLLGVMKVLLAVFGVALWRGQGGGLDFGLLLSVVGVVTLLYGELMAWRQSDLKRLLAYSTIAQVGEIAAVLGLGTTLAMAGAAAHVLTHGMMKTLLFLGAGALIMRAGTRTLADLAGIARRMPFTAACLGTGLLAIMGLPPFAGFVSKFLMIYAAARAGAWPVAAALLAGGVIGVMYYARILRVVFFDAPSAVAQQASEVPWAMRLPLAVLAALLLALGLVPAPLLALAGAAANAVGAAHGVAGAVLPSLMPDWPLAAVVCAVGGVATLVLGRAGRATAGAAAVGTMLAALAAIGYESARYDALSLPFAVVVAGMGALNLLYSLGYFAHHGHKLERFLGFTVLMIGGLLGMAGAHDLFAFFFFWEVMSSWTLYLAIIHDETPEALREGGKYFVFNIAGASFLFLGVAVLGAAAGSFAFADIAAAARTMPVATLALGAGAAVAGFAMKAAMLTVRVDYQMHPAPAPTPVSGYISAVLLKSGPLGAFKLIVLLGGTAVLSRLGTVAGLDPISYFLVVLGAVTALYAGLMAFIQTGVKRLLIYSTVSQLGYVMCGLALGDPLSTAGGLAHALNHALLKNTLFLAAGAILAQQHIVSLDALGGAGRRMPWTFAFFAFSGLSLAGLPPFNGLGSKWLLYEGALSSGHPFVALALMGASLTTLAAVLKFIHAAFLGAESPVSAKLHEAPATMLLPMALLTALSLAISVMPGLLLVPVAHVQAGLGLQPIAASWFGPLPGAYGWHPLTLALPLAALLAVGWLLMRAGRPAPTPSHAHTCGVELAPEAMRMAASNLYGSPARLVRRVFMIREQQS
ncbi:MAG: proton-conducting transporter membrane subunit [Rubrivivax sp.]